ncbi:MAG: hypothetical protein GC129_00280 [Proteobacteria bacterium]|nr:hypothetical protein [Pseudomonadota bacterium]
MKNLLLTVLLGSGVAASALAVPVELDARTVTQQGVSARMVRFTDPAAKCPAYGVVMVSEGGKPLGQAVICGAENIVSALQGDQVVLYVFARDSVGALGVFRDIAARNQWDYYDFKASGLKISSLGTQVMVRGEFAPQAGQTKPQTQAWTWHPNFAQPEQVEKAARYQDKF